VGAFAIQISVIPSIDLHDRVAAVTGAGTGLGRAIADQLAAAGAQVAVLEVNPVSGPAAAAELAHQHGVKTVTVQTDVADRAAVDAAFARVQETFGRLDIAVNNAGVSHVGPFTQDVTDEHWDETIAVMQTGVFYCMRAAGRLMLEQHSGSIVNISSIRGFSPNPGRLAYCAVKAAVIMMTKVAAGEWTREGVRVNAVAPGVERTPMWDADVARGAIDESRYLDVVPAGTLGDPEDVGRLVAYLCSDNAAYISGSVVTIDGGLTSIPAG
jgi:NAD(P)-dependent dehydrogenase (short-subunit alcohol dehydrogenase family)